MSYEGHSTAQSLFSVLETEKTERENERHLMRMTARLARKYRKYWYQARLFTGLLILVL